MNFRNATNLCDARLLALFTRHTFPYRHDELKVRVRYSRKAQFSGTCFYRDARIFVNLGRRNVYPFTFGTHIARARSNRTRWWRETYRLTVADAYQLSLFVYLHELYHYLIKAAGRCTRRKEAMCDRFATRTLMDHYGCRVTDGRQRPVPRERWDFKDLHEFIGRAPKEAFRALPFPAAIPVTIRGF